jgi:hypothetical protein
MDAYANVQFPHRVNHSNADRKIFRIILFCNVRSSFFLLLAYKVSLLFQFVVE